MNEQPYLMPTTGFIDESQRASLANALRQGAPQYHGAAGAPSASIKDMQALGQGMGQAMDSLGQGVKKLNGDNATADYVNEFGKFDPQMTQSLGNDATLMQKFSGMFGGGNG